MGAPSWKLHYNLKLYFTIHTDTRLEQKTRFVSKIGCRNSFTEPFLS